MENIKTDKDIEKLEKYTSEGNCEIDKFFNEMITNYRAHLCGDEQETYDDYVHYIHTLIDCELSAIWFDISESKKRKDREREKLCQDIKDLEYEIGDKQEQLKAMYDELEEFDDRNEE